MKHVRRKKKRSIFHVDTAFIQIGIDNVTMFTNLKSSQNIQKHKMFTIH